MENYKCSYCGKDLEYEDYYGKVTGWDNFHNEPIISHHGDIFRCNNEECTEQGQWYYEDETGLNEGYPC